MIRTVSILLFFALFIISACEFDVPKHPSEVEEEQVSTVDCPYDSGDDQECDQGFTSEDLEVFLETSPQDTEPSGLDLGENSESDCYDYIHRGNLIYIDYRPCEPGEVPPEN